MQMPITLWDIMKLFKSREFALFLNDLQESQNLYERCREALKSGDTSVQPLSESEIERVLEFLKEGEHLCADTGLRGSSVKLFATHSHLKHFPEKADWSSLYSDYRNISDVMMSEFWNRKFVQVPADYQTYVNSPALFGDVVNTAFPSAREDMKQAGNCLAVECGTAAVFHLMRAVEWGLRSLCGSLGILRILKKKTGKPKYIPVAWAEWDKMLEAVHDRVDKKMLSMAAGKRKQDAQEFYYPLLRDLRGFKEAFRNHVMHTRREYTPEDAKAVLDHVQRFMTLLATKVKQ